MDFPQNDPGSGIQWRIPIEIIKPTLVQIVGRKVSPVLMQIRYSWLKWRSCRKHMHIRRQAISFAKIAGRAGRYNIFPNRRAAFSAWNDVVESQFLPRTTVLTGKPITKEHIESSECRMPRRPNIGLEGHYRGQTHFKAGASHAAIVMGNYIYPIKEHGLNGILPGPQ